MYIIYCCKVGEILGDILGEIVGDFLGLLLYKFLPKVNVSFMGERIILP